MHFWSTDHSKCFTRADAAMFCANLLIRSDTGLPIQSALQYFYAQPFTHSHTHTNGTDTGKNMGPQNILPQETLQCRDRPTELCLLSTAPQMVLSISAIL